MASDCPKIWALDCLGDPLLHGNEEEPSLGLHRLPLLSIFILRLAGIVKGGKNP